MQEVDILFILAQIVGAIEFFFCIVGDLKLKTDKILFYNSVTTALAIVEYCLLGAWTGITCCVAILIRNIVFRRYKKQIPLYILLIFIAMVIIINLPTIHTIFDALLTLNIIAFAIALWTKNVMLIKIVGLATVVPCVMYNFVNQAYVAILQNVVIGSVQLGCIYHLCKKKRNKKTKTKNKNKKKLRG